jgi:hypothetical protein
VVDFYGGFRLKSLIVVHSYYHSNTQKVAQAMAKVLDAQAKSPQQTNREELNQYDLRFWLRDR